MTGHNSNLRLDQILLEDGLVTNDQIIEALHYQKQHGGKLGSHLMRFGYVEESGLVQALARQYGCEGIVLSDLEIPEIIIKFVPAKIAIARRVVPFDYNPEKNLLMVACPDPSDRYLIDELNFVARGKKVKLYIAVEQALKEAIEQYYEAGLKLTGEIALEEFNSANKYKSDNNSSVVSAVSDENSEESHHRLLLVGGTQEEQACLKSLYEASDWKVQAVDSGDRVPAYLDVSQFDQVIIKKTDTKAIDNLRRQLRMRSSMTNLKTFEHLTDLIGEPSDERHTDLMIKNLDLFTLLLGSKGKQKINRSSIVGRYVHELCFKLNLDSRERAVIISAAYVHDLARYYYDQSVSSADDNNAVELTVKLLKSLDYSKEVIAVLEAVQQEYDPDDDIRLEVIGGSIITAVSEMVQTIPVDDKISLEKLASFRVWLSELTGKKVITKVATTLLEMIEEKMLACSVDDRFSHVLILGGTGAEKKILAKRLKQEEFHLAIEQTVDAFVSLYQRGEPDMIILVDSGEPDYLGNVIDRLIDCGVDLSTIPTFVLAESVTLKLSALLANGIEDIVPVGDNLNMLAAKMNRIRTRVKAEQDSQALEITANKTAGTQGQLSDMNLIELLQVLGPSRKTVHLTVISNEEKLLIYLCNGEIIWAKIGETEGAEAVHQGISWMIGVWIMNTIEESEIPERNVFDQNESIIMEGCRLLDESTQIEVPPGGITSS